MFVCWRYSYRTRSVVLVYDAQTGVLLHTFAPPEDNAQADVYVELCAFCIA